MKIKLIACLVFFSAMTLSSHAQHVSVRLNFPVGIRSAAPGPSPYPGAIWIGPEWQWRNGGYMSVPGYWARPRHYGAVWVPGHWKYSRRGYRWVPGHWR